MGIFNDVRREYSKVQWPRRKEVVAATTWVVVMGVFLGVYLGVFDIVATKVLKMLVSLFGG